MKLRIRSLESKQTLRIEVSSPCSIEHLKSAIADKISSPSQSLHLSLNRRDEIGADPRESLDSIGLTSGDLIFYALNPDSLSSGRAHLVAATERGNSVPDVAATSSSGGAESGSASTTGRDGNSVCKSKERASEENVQREGDSPYPMSSGDGCNPGENTLGFSNVGDGNVANMEIDQSDIAGRSVSVPCFLSRALKADLDSVSGNSSQLLVFAIHCTFLESGFVACVSNSGCAIDGFGLSEVRAAFEKPVVCVKYTVTGAVFPNSSNIAVVVLKFISLGKYVSVYGSVTGSSDSFHVNFHASRIGSAIHNICGNDNSLSATSVLSYEKELYEFWKTVKDRLSLPLLILLSEKAGLAPPPCFMRLPTDLKNHILEFLPGQDIAKMACVCLEMKYLAANDDLWKQKYIEEFVQLDRDGASVNHWKEKFAYHWVRKKRVIMVAQRRQSHHGFNPRFPVRRPAPFGSPNFIIGGEYDRVPGFVGGLPFRTRRNPRFPARNFSPDCRFDL